MKQLLMKLNNFNMRMIIWVNILCIGFLAQVNCTKVFLFNPHPISIFPKDSIFMPALHTSYSCVFQYKGIAAPFPMIIILSVIWKCTSFDVSYIVMMSLNKRLRALFGAAVDDSVARSHETHNKFRAQIKQWAIRDWENI